MNDQNRKSRDREFFCERAGVWDGAVVDVRAPSEFLRGHIANAINIPLLDDEQRHVVGCLYKKEGRVAAIEEALVAFSKRCDQFLERIDAIDAPILVYCWRGGMRSRAVTHLLASVGIDVWRLQAGYKGYRHQVLALIEEFSQKQLLVLHGRTGSGKTELIRELRGRAPVVDFERCAAHRGSAFGGMNQSRPLSSQQLFENMIAEQFYECRKADVVVVEIENHIGPVRLPQKLWERVSSSPMVLIERQFERRVHAIVDEYKGASGFEVDASLFEQGMLMLKRFVSDYDYNRIKAAYREADFESVVTSLLQLRYDKAYAKGLKRCQTQFIARFDIDEQRAELESFIGEFCGKGRVQEYDALVGNSRTVERLYS